EREPSATGLCSRCLQHEPCYTASSVLLFLLSFGGCATQGCTKKTIPSIRTAHCALCDAFYKSRIGGRMSPPHQVGVPPCVMFLCRVYVSGAGAIGNVRGVLRGVCRHY